MQWKNEFSLMLTNNAQSMFRFLPTDRIFVLTGAGISAESGIPTFRGEGGLWRNYRIEEVASPYA
jgi:NAD-dependent deacetylase